MVASRLTMEELVSTSSCDFVALAATFASKIAAGNSVSRFLDNLELDSDVYGHSLCQALRKSWQSIAQGLNVSDSNRVEKAFSTTDFTSSLLWAQIALDFAWSKLNSGSWRDVGLVWRKVYATAALFKAISLLSVGGPQEALSETDKGILLGAPVFGDALKNFASILSHQIQHTTSPSDDLSTCVTQSSLVDIQPAGKCPRIGKIVFKNYSSYQEPSTGPVVRASAADHSNDVADVSTVPLIDMARRIMVVNCPSLEEFYCKYMMNSTSVVVSGGMDHWPAYSERKWRCVIVIVCNICTCTCTRAVADLGGGGG